MPEVTLHLGVRAECGQNTSQHTPSGLHTPHSCSHCAQNDAHRHTTVASAVPQGSRHVHLRLFQSLIKLEQLGHACPPTGPSTPAFMNHVAPGGKSSIWEPGVMLSMGLLRAFPGDSLQQSKSFTTELTQSCPDVRSGPASSREDVSVSQGRAKSLTRPRSGTAIPYLHPNEMPGSLLGCREEPTRGTEDLGSALALLLPL